MGTHTSSIRLPCSPARSDPIMSICSSSKPRQDRPAWSTAVSSRAPLHQPRYPEGEGATIRGRERSRATASARSVCFSPPGQVGDEEARRFPQLREGDAIVRVGTPSEDHEHPAQELLRQLETARRPVRVRFSRGGVPPLVAITQEPVSAAVNNTSPASRFARRVRAHHRRYPALSKHGNERRRDRD